MSFLALSDLGAEVMARRSSPHYAYLTGAPETGATWPRTLYERMRQVDAAAQELDGLIQVHVQRAAFKSSWFAWCSRWKSFFTHYQTIFAKLGVLFHSDDVAMQIEVFRQELVKFREGYAAEVDERGQLLPPPITPAPVAPADEPPQKSFAERFLPEFPWWGYLVGGVVLVGGGYLVYRMVKVQVDDLKAKRRGIEEHVLPNLIGKDLAAAASTHASDRDPEIVSKAILENGPVALDLDQKNVATEMLPRVLRRQEG